MAAAAPGPIAIPRPYLSIGGGIPYIPPDKKKNPNNAPAKLDTGTMMVIGRLDTNWERARINQKLIKYKYHFPS